MVEILGKEKSSILKAMGQLRTTARVRTSVRFFLLGFAILHDTRDRLQHDI